MISLAGGIPAPDLIDTEGLEAATCHAIKSAPDNIYQYGLTEGERFLREEIASHMVAQGICVEPDHILVTTGSQQALDIVARTFLDEGDSVLVEEPTYLAALQVFDMAGANTIAFQVDQHGIDFTRLESLAAKRRIKLMYLVPNFSNPTGRTLPLAERMDLVEFAIRHDILIVEDDPYGDLRYDGDHVASLFKIAEQSFNSKHRVIYISSFSKTLAPGLRLGWCIPPESYFHPLCRAKQSMDLHSSTLSQYIAGYYLKSGRLDNRLKLLKKAYKSRRDALIKAIAEHLPGTLELNVPEGGMFLWGRFSNGLDASLVLKQALSHNVMFVPGKYFYSGTPDLSSIRLSFSTITPSLADEAVKRLAIAIQKTEQLQAQE
ncbi:PLP-dependent aminotransferase family protein [Marinobacter sp.]|uniref:aminotransferase-like domain-containing protein n=1 Tax=Marinobacter sp. TaxID=50741 RepID=UPI001B752EFE|nr:PLP-dependent aminotransferase family protein [Marinobacter sp.]MBQ0832726.1 PLP-dependent aminotransferase family protein [Marinobacter sp.]